MKTRETEITENSKKPSLFRRVVDTLTNALNTVDHFISVLYGFTRASDKGLLPLDQVSKFANSPLTYSILAVPSMILVAATMLLFATNKTPKKRSLHTRIMEIVTGAAIIALTCAMLAGAPFMVIPTSAIGLFKGFWNLTTHTASLLFGKKKEEVAKSAAAARENNIEIANKVHNIVIGAVTLIGAALLPTPLAPIGAAILLAVTIYTLGVAIFEWATGVNPFKWALTKASDAILGEPKDEPRKENKPFLENAPLHDYRTKSEPKPKTMTYDVLSEAFKNAPAKKEAHAAIAITADKTNLTTVENKVTPAFTLTHNRKLQESNPVNSNETKLSIR